MRMIARLAVVPVALFGLAACSGTSVTAEDAYKIGCPAVDTAVAGGGVAAKATLAGLKKLSESGRLDPEPQKWLDATISLLEADGDPNQVSTEAKQLIIDGCANNGYPLKNLKSESASAGMPQRANRLPDTVVMKFFIESGRSRRCQLSGP